MGLLYTKTHGLKFIHQTSKYSLIKILEQKCILSGKDAQLSRYDYSDLEDDYLPTTFLELATPEAIEILIEENEEPIMVFKDSILEKCTQPHFTPLWYYGQFNIMNSYHLRDDQEYPESKKIKLEEEIAHIV